MSNPLPILSRLETRVLGVLVEKQHTVPDSYPLTVNALTLGCNQKTSRDPILAASDAEVQGALDHLKSLSLVFESSGGRVMRYEHNVGRVLQLNDQGVALLAVLWLRGAQTPGELRGNCERIHRFADISALQGFLEDLATRPGGPLVVELPRQPGARENRWAHLLSGEPAGSHDTPAAPDERIDLGELAALKHNVAELRAEVITLKAALAHLSQELGVRPSDPT